MSALAHPRRSRPRGTDAFQRVLTIRSRVSRAETASFTRNALSEIHKYIEQQELEVAGPPFSICHPLPGDRADVEAGWPVTRGLGDGHIHSGALPVSQIRAQVPSLRDPVAGSYP